VLDINLIREKPDWVKQQVINLNDEAPIDEILEADIRRRELLQIVEDLRSRRKKSSKQIGHWMGTLNKIEQDLRRANDGQDVGQPIDGLTTQAMALKANIDGAKEETRDIGDQINSLEQELRTVDESLREMMLWVPNMPHETVPIGPDDSHNVVVKTIGKKPKMNFQPRPHWELGPALGILDFERGVKLSGSRFYLLIGAGSQLQRALIQFMLDYHVNEHGYTEVYLPFMTRSEMFVGAAQLPKFAENIYRDAEEDFMWLATAEIALTNIHRDEILAESQLPISYVAYTPCFRREKMSAGRDVRGIKRGHQFDKVEMYKFTRPDNSYEALQQLLDHAGDICDALELPFRIVEMVTGDLGFAAAKKYDLEVWAAGCEEWLEVSSCSNCEAFQARRANIRYRPNEGGKPKFVHTLNGSGLALPRILIALLENNQNQDGSVTIPEVLRPYLGGVSVVS
jgi:seryl-tRNA synthetase